MTAQQQRKRHLLSIVHLLGIAALAIWWTAYFWQHSPSRDVFRLHRPTQHQTSRVAGMGLSKRTDALALSQTERTLAAARAGIADLSGGLLVVAAFAVGTGVHVRRAEIWLQARTSGEAVAFGGTELVSATLDANADRGGILR